MHLLVNQNNEKNMDDDELALKKNQKPNTSVNKNS